ncbi:MAG: rhomboid family intramembrane serine protease [Methylacidiphilales bacterium]|nr:rhomboid family intramembrane serine protease [Candidatus Methylacidiphilales bacterium]
MTEPYPPFDPYPWKPPKPWVTWFIVGSTVAVFLLQLLEVHLHGRDIIGDRLAFSSEALAQHRYWTLLSYAWVHAVVIFGDPGLFWLHIVANMIPLFCLGPLLEEFLGRGYYLGLYLGGAVASAIVWLMFNSHSGPDDGIIGASGAVFAVIAAAGTAAPRVKVTVYLFYVLPLHMNLAVLAITACAVEVVQLVFGWMGEVAHSAHLGGAAFGFFYVLAYRLIFRKSL